MGYYEVLEECNRAALEFSERYNIVKSEEWANLIIEDGLMGGFTEDRGKRIKEVWANLTEDEKQKRRQKSNPWSNKTESELDLHRNNLKESMIEMYQSADGKALLEHKRQVGKSLLKDGKRILTEEARQRMRESAIRTNEIRRIKKEKDNA